MTFSKVDICKIYKNLLQEFRGNDDIERRVLGDLSVNKDNYLALITNPISLDESEIHHLESCYENIPDNVIQKQIKLKAINIMKVNMRKDLMKLILQMKERYEDEVDSAASSISKIVKNRERRLRDINKYLHINFKVN